ncbi:hypothetical protein [uncultured Bradyrhizobium sp.]|uniref:hypothetical protein n=1 Tax=uncultured Bradyrhizobium sp. TaxID=199684 RepID=UPI0035CAC89E
MPMALTNEEMRQEITFVTRFSRVYFDAFMIGNDRIKYFDLLNILLDCRPEELKVKALMQNKRIHKLLDLKEGQEPRHKFDGLMNGFKNEAGSLWRLIRTRPHKDRYIAFNSNYDECVRRYLAKFKEMVVPNLSIPEKMPTSEAKRLFRHIIKFIRTKHWDAWQQAIDQILAASGGGDRDKIIRNSTYWVIILATWKKHLGDRETINTVEGFKREIYTTIGMPAGDVEAVLNELCALGILEEGKSSDIWVYTPRSDIRPILSAYTEELHKLRLALPSEVAVGLALS